MVSAIDPKKIPVRGRGPWAGFWRDRSNDQDDRNDDGEEGGMDAGGDMGGDGGGGGGGESYSPADDLIKSRLNEGSVSDYPEYVKARDAARAGRRSEKLDAIHKVATDHGYIKSSENKFIPQQHSTYNHPSGNKIHVNNYKGTWQFSSAQGSSISNLYGRRDLGAVLKAYHPDSLVGESKVVGRVSDYPKYVKARDAARNSRRSTKGLANIPDNHSGYYDDGFGGEIHHADASEIAGQWHGGQWSNLYKLASTGHVDSSTEQEVSSLLNDISKNPSKYPEDGQADYDNHTQIKRLHNYVVSRIKMGHHGRLV